MIIIEAGSIIKVEHLFRVDVEIYRSISSNEWGGESAMETVKGPDSKEERIEHMVLQYQLPLLKLFEF